MLPNYFRPRSGNFGALFVSTSVTLGTGSTDVADSTTTSVLLPKPACTTCQLVGVNMSALIAAASSGGVVTVQVFKRDNSGTPADRTLTATKSIEADVITVTDQTYTIAITSTSIQNLTFRASDACRIDAVAASTIQTDPVLTITGLWAIVQP